MLAADLVTQTNLCCTGRLHQHSTLIAMYVFCYSWLAVLQDRRVENIVDCVNHNHQQGDKELACYIVFLMAEVGVPIPACLESTAVLADMCAAQICLTQQPCLLCDMAGVSAAREKIEAAGSQRLAAGPLAASHRVGYRPHINNALRGGLLVNAVSAWAMPPWVAPTPPLLHIYRLELDPPPFGALCRARRARHNALEGGGDRFQLINMQQWWGWSHP